MTKPFEIPEAIFYLLPHFLLFSLFFPFTVPSGVESEPLTDCLRNAPSPALPGLLCGQR